MTNNTSNPLPEFPFTFLRFKFTAIDNINLPLFAGSVFRGGFGAALRKCCCTMPEKNCKDCMLASLCVYAAVFETAISHVKKKNYQLSDYPRPFIIEPAFGPRNFISKGNPFYCNLILMGFAINQLPYFIYAFLTLGKWGIGSKRGRFKIDLLETIRENMERITVFNGRSERFVNPAIILNTQDFFSKSAQVKKLSLVFKTPVRIKYKNRLAKDLNFSLFIKNLLRRISLLGAVCTKTTWNPNFKELIEASENIDTIKYGLMWYDWRRYSARQKDSMKLGGLVGKIIFQGALEPFMPFIRLGEYFHIGKAATFGLGKYIIEKEEFS